MALFALALGAAGRFFRKKLAQRTRRAVPTFSRPTGGLTPGEEQDLGFDNAPAAGTAMEVSREPQLPAVAGTMLGAVTVSPSHVVRAKCPRGYSFVDLGRGIIGTVAHGSAGVCVITKVARALGLVRRKRGRGISARDLRAALRVTRLVRHIVGQLPKSRSRGLLPRAGGHRPGCGCVVCRRR
jgi:hypothetical protein